MPVPRFPEGREPVAPDATDEIARRARLLQALLVLIAGQASAEIS